MGQETGIEIAHNAPRLNVVFAQRQRSKNEPKAEHRSDSEERSVLAARYATRHLAHGHGRPGAVSPFFISSVLLYGITFLCNKVLILFV